MTSMLALAVAWPIVAAAALAVLWRAPIIRRWRRAGGERDLVTRLLQRVGA